MTQDQRGSAGQVDRRAREFGFEQQEPPPLAVALGLAGVLGLALTALALVALTLSGFQSRAPQPRVDPLERASLRPPPPRLQVAPRAERAAVEAAAEEKLHGYGWSDQPGRSARIPIERAMRLQAQQGWPDPKDRP